MKQFELLQEKAIERGYKLQRAADSNGCVKSGYILWDKGGLWKRYATLQEVWVYLSRKFLVVSAKRGSE